MRFVVAASVILGSVLSAAAWDDCTLSSVSKFGPFNTLSEQTVLPAAQGLKHDTTLYMHYPSNKPPSGDKYPVVIFMHGMTLGYEFYKTHLEHWASHGLVVLFPFVKTAAKDDAIFPIVTQTDGASIMATVSFASDAASNTSSPLYGIIDTTKLAIAGHSMGGEDAIKATSKLPPGTAKVVVSQHPSLCGPLGPPPYPYTYSKQEMHEANNRTEAIILFTADNDRAFMPGTPKSERGCWEGGTDKGIFVQMAKEACDSYPPCSTTGCKAKVLAVGDGHMCACASPNDKSTWVSPELKWVTAAFKLYLQYDGREASRCHGLLWGNGTDSLMKSNDTSNVEIRTGPRQYIEP